MHVKINFHIFSPDCLHSLCKKQDKAIAIKKREDIKSRKHFTVFNIP